MTITIAGEWKSKGRPPKWLPKFMRGWFTWTKSGKFEEATEFSERVLLEIGTPVGTLSVAVDGGHLFVALSGVHKLVDIELVNEMIPFSFSASGQSIEGLIRAK